MATWNVFVKHRITHYKDMLTVDADCELTALLKASIQLGESHLDEEDRNWRHVSTHAVNARYARMIADMIADQDEIYEREEENWYREQDERAAFENG